MVNIWTNWDDWHLTIPLSFQILITAQWYGTIVRKKIHLKWKQIQERALRFIYEDYDSSYGDLLQKSKLPSLKIQRIRTIAIETFKIIHRESPQYLHDLIDIKARSYNFRSKNTAAVPRVRITRYGLKCFRNRPFNLKRGGRLCFFSKKNSDSQCCWKKYSDFDGGKK